MEDLDTLWVIPCTYDGISSPVHSQNFPVEGRVRIVTIINTKSLGQPVFTSPTGHLIPNSPSALRSPAHSSRVSQPWRRVFVLENWLELPTETFCQAGLKDRQATTAKWKCSTSHCPQTESIAGCSFAEEMLGQQNTGVGACQLTSLTTKMLLDTHFTAVSSEGSREKQKANNKKGQAEPFALLQKPEMVPKV